MINLTSKEIALKQEMLSIRRQGIWELITTEANKEQEHRESEKMLSYAKDLLEIDAQESFLNGLILEYREILPKKNEQVDGEKKYIIAHKISDSEEYIFLGTHRVNHGFQENIFSSWRANAYQYTLEEAQAKVTELEGKGWECSYIEF